MKELYLELLKELKDSNSRGHYMYLCRLARRIDSLLLEDLQQRLLNIESTDPDLLVNSLCGGKITPKVSIQKGYAFWYEYDFKSRKLFIERIIKQL